MSIWLVAKSVTLVSFDYAVQIQFLRVAVLVFNMLKP